MYYIYEIVGVKVGCTQNIETRQRQQISKGKMIVLEYYTNIKKAALRERELQVEKGYEVDSTLYTQVMSMQVASQNPKARKKAGKSLSSIMKGKIPLSCNTPEANKNKSIAKKGKVQTHMLTPQAIKNRVKKVVKPINQFTLKGEFIREWPSIKEAADNLNLQPGQISNCLNRKNSVNTVGGFFWKHASYGQKLTKEDIKSLQNKCKRVVDVWKGEKIGSQKLKTHRVINSVYIGRFNSIQEASEAIKVSGPAINGLIKRNGISKEGYTFKYA